MRILFLALDVDLRLARGDSIHTRELYNGLIELGHEVILVTATPLEFVPNGIRHITRVDSTHAQVGALLKFASDWADIMYERRLSPKLSWSLSLLSGIPFVTEVNGCLEEELAFLGRRSTRLGGKLRQKVRAAILRHSRAIVAVSKGIRDYLISHYQIDPTKIVVVSNGANTQEFVPLDMQSCRLQLGLESNDKTVCYVGNMVRWQGVDVLLNAADALSRKLPGLTLLMVGDGPELVDLRSMSSDLGLSARTRFEGVVPHSQVPLYIGAANACVAPFRATRKASPLKVFEYMACGRPVVVTDTDEVAEFVRRSGGGIVVPADDVKALADAVGWLLAHESEAAMMGTKAREAIVRARSWQATAEGVARVLLDSVCSGKPANPPRHADLPLVRH